MLEESGVAEVIRKQRAISFAPRPIPRELPDPQTVRWWGGVGGGGAGRGEETGSVKHRDRKRIERRVRGMGERKEETSVKEGRKKPQDLLGFEGIERVPTTVGVCVMNACIRGMIPIRALVHLLGAVDSRCC